MNKLILLTIMCAMAYLSGFSQITADKSDGGTVETKITGNNKLNKNSTLKREKTTINDASCPIKLYNIGVGTVYSIGQSCYYYYPYGTFKTKEPIVAFETNHVLYDVFGNYMYTLSKAVVLDIETSYIFNNEEKWNAQENEVKTYYSCVSYVTHVRTKNDVIWHCNDKEIKKMLDTMYAPFDEDFISERGTGDI